NIQGGLGAGIHVAGDDNLISFNTIASNQGVGLAVLSGARNVIEGDTIVWNLGHGVDILSGTGSVIRSNFIGTDASGAVAGNIGDGVRIEGGASQTTITGNKICFNTGVGIDIISGSNNSVSGNVVCDNGGDGIDVDAGTGTNLSGNSIYDNGG